MNNYELIHPLFAEAFNLQAFKRQMLSVMCNATERGDQGSLHFAAGVPRSNLFEGRCSLIQFLYALYKSTDRKPYCVSLIMPCSFAKLMTYFFMAVSMALENMSLG